MRSRRKLGKLKPPSELTEGEWVRELEHIDNQLTHVLDVFNFLEELFRLSNESEAALGAFNTTPLFWHVFRDCLQESMFMGLGRLCDPSSDVVNVTLDTLRQLVAGLRFFYDNGTLPRVDVRGTKALDLTPRRFFRDVVRAVAGREL